MSIGIAKSTSWAARMLTTFNGHGTSALKRQSPQVCYYPSGEISPYDIPCGTGEAVVCCPNEWTCEDNGLCSLPSKQYYGLFSCTDWSSSHCPTSCANGKPPHRRTANDRGGGTRRLKKPRRYSAELDGRRGGATMQPRKLLLRWPSSGPRMLRFHRCTVLPGRVAGRHGQRSWS